MPRGRGGVSQTTRDRVLKVADDLGYVPNRIAVAGITDYIPESKRQCSIRCCHRDHAGIIFASLEHSDASRIMPKSTTPK